jgi:Methyltransferase domain/Glycosyl transferases group 1
MSRLAPVPTALTDAVAITDATSARFLCRPIAFQEPERIVSPASWLAHTPFAFWLIDALRPTTFVELGCHSGNSYASFAQAVQTLGLPAACYAVDTWQGDPHAGFFDETVFEEWSAYHDRRFSAFSRLIRATFDEAVEHFDDGTIDLLHMDGYHTFDAVSHDFDSWRPKLTDGGIVLCHDINVREKDFGAWQLWERLREEYPSFEFLHGHGLGVLGVGHDLPDPVTWLLSLRSESPETLAFVRQFFSRLGEAVVRRYLASDARQSARRETAEHDQQIANAQRQLHDQHEHLAAVQAELTTQNERFAMVQRELSSRDQQIADAQRQLHDQHGHFTTVQAELATQNERLAMAQCDISSRDEQLARAAADVGRLSSELEAAREQLDVARAEAARLNAALAAAEGARAVEADAVQATLAERDTRIEDSRAQIARYAATVRVLETRIADLSSDASAHERQIARLRRDLAQVPRALSARDEIVRGLERDVTALLERLPTGRHRDGSTNSATSISRVRVSATSLAPRSDRPTVLLVSHVGPWKPRAGNAYRIQRLLRWYQRKQYRIIPVIAPLPGEELPTEGVGAIAREFGNAVQCHRDGRVEYVLEDVPGALASLDRTFTPSLATLLVEPPDADGDARARRVVQLERLFCHDVVASTALHLSRALGPHILQVEYIWMTRLLPLTGGDVLKVVDTHDVLSSIPDKVTAFGMPDVTIEPHEEAVRLARADVAIAIQDDERAELQRLVPSLPIITAGVDFDVAADPGTSAAGRILYVASNNPRNRRGLEDFLSLAWPRIHRSVPEAVLLVAGSVADTLGALEVAGVEVLGRIDDLAEQYRRASLVINPAVAGTGLKVKILEALCHFRPVVTWPAGIDGLDPSLSAYCLIARDWYEFSGHVIAALAGTACRPFQEEDRAIVAAQMAPERVYAAIDATFDAFFAQSMVNDANR